MRNLPVILGVIAVVVCGGALAIVILRRPIRQDELRNRHEIALLDTAMTSLVEEYKLRWLPSKLELNPSPKGSLSEEFILQMFPKIDPQGKYAWNGKDTESVTLEGQHVLVFLLGGVPSEDKSLYCTGFSTDATNPAASRTPDVARKAPMFEFRPRQLKRDMNGFLVYLDIFGKVPYAFFSTGKNENVYDRKGDCPGISRFLPPDWPVPRPYLYSQEPLVFMKQNSWQIISAGPDCRFGAGGVVWPPISRLPKTDPQADDQANFAERPLGYK
jgi:hypothetical protein